MRRIRSSRARGAGAPVDDLGLVDGEAVVVGGIEARCLAGGALDIDHRAAGAADEVVVVVAELQLEAGRVAGRLELADEAVRGQRAEDVVDRLGAHGPESLAGGTGDGVDVGVGDRGQLAQDGDAWGGHAQRVGAQQVGGSLGLDHRAHRHQSPTKT